MRTVASRPDTSRRVCLVLISAFSLILVALSATFSLTDRSLRFGPNSAVGQLPAHLDQDCITSLRESDGFFCESDQAWTRIKQITREQQDRQRAGLSRKSPNWATFWNQQFHPEFHCRFTKRIGGMGDGGKWVCDPHRIRELAAALNQKCVVYSIGSKNEFDFEKDVHRNLPECEIHTFDFTVAHPAPPPYVQFHKWGLSGTDNDTLLTLSTIREKLGHTPTSGTRIDLLKIDVEGDEFDALNDILNDPPSERNALRGVRQILIEIHGFSPSFERVTKLFADFSRNGWVIAYKEFNVIGQSSCCSEYTFVKLDWDSEIVPVNS